MSPLAGPQSMPSARAAFSNSASTSFLSRRVQHGGNVAAILDHERHGVVQPGVIAVGKAGAMKDAVMHQAFGADLQAGDEFFRDHFAAIGEAARIVEGLRRYPCPASAAARRGRRNCPPA